VDGIVQSSKCLNPACGKPLRVPLANKYQSKLFCSKACRRVRHNQKAQTTRGSGR
jgi:endogenous inhibitor of DNA gyrase (YacG/DUF329 family)